MTGQINMHRHSTFINLFQILHVYLCACVRTTAALYECRDGRGRTPLHLAVELGMAH